MKLSELKDKITTILRERSTYKLGTQEYTKKNLTPTDILDLAMAYSQVKGKGTTLWGNKMEKMIRVGNDLAKLNGTTQLDAKKRGKPALILTLLKNKLVTKDEYIKLYKDLLLKQTSVVKALKNADPASRMVGGAAARAAHRDMKSESVVNEMSMGFDSMTGLFYLQGVPFTRERIKEVILFMKNSKPKSKVNQFEYTPALIVKDKVGKNEVTIDPKNLKTLIEFYKKNSAKLATDKDF